MYKIWVQTAVQYTITIRAKNNTDPTGETLSNYGLYYNANGGSDVLISDISGVTTTCATVNTFTVSSGTSLYLGFKKIGDNTGRSFAISNSTNCNLATGTYCGTLGTGDAQYYNYGTVTSNQTFAFDLSVSGGTYVICSV